MHHLFTKENVSNLKPNYNNPSISSDLESNLPVFVTTSPTKPISIYGYDPKKNIDNGTKDQARINFVYEKAAQLSPTEKLMLDADIKTVCSTYKISPYNIKMAFPPILTPEIKDFCASIKLSPAYLWTLLISPQKFLPKDEYKYPEPGIPRANGPLSFENEKGYIQGMYLGLAFILKTISLPLNANLYKEIHNAAVTGVRKSNPNGLAESYFKQGFSPWCLLGSIPSVVLKEGAKRGSIFSLFVKESTGKPDEYMSVFGFEGLMSSRNDPKKDEEDVNKIFDNYRKEIAKSTTDHEKLVAISTCCQDLEFKHILPDGNGRTIDYLLLIRLLKENNLAPVILKDIDFWDTYYTPQQMAAKLVAGMKDFKRIPKIFPEMKMYQTKKNLIEMFLPF